MDQPVPLSRRAQFKVALIRAGLTAKAWAALKGVSPTHLYLVLDGERPSERLNAEIDAFMAPPVEEAVSA